MSEQLDFSSSLNSLRDLPSHIIVESFKVVDKFIKNSSVTPVQLFLKASLDQSYKFQKSFQTVTLLPDDEFIQTTGYRYNSGIVAIFEKPSFIQEDQIEYPAVILNGLTKVENVGAIVRSASAFGFKTLIIDQSTCSPFLRRAIRVSMGNISLMKVHRTQNLKKLIEDSNAEVFATANLLNSISFNDWKPGSHSAVIIGSEGHGVESDIMKVCSDTIRIPILDSVEHLNASAAAAIICSKYSVLFDTAK